MSTIDTDWTLMQLHCQCSGLGLFLQCLFSLLVLRASLRLSGTVVSPVSVLKGPFLHGAAVGGVGTKVVYSISGTGMLWFCAGGKMWSVLRVVMLWVGICQI